MFFIFEKLTATHLPIMFPLSLINLMNKVLIFGNGQLKFEVSMYFHNKMYNLKHGEKEFLFYRQTNLSMLYFIFFLILYEVFFFFFFFHYIGLHMHQANTNNWQLWVHYFSSKALKTICYWTLYICEKNRYFIMDGM